MKLTKMFAAGLFTALMSAGAATADQVKIGIAAEPYPPFASLDASGKWVGWGVEVIDAFALLPSLIASSRRWPGTGSFRR